MLSLSAGAEPVSTTLRQPGRHASQQVLVIVEALTNLTLAIRRQELRHALLELTSRERHQKQDLA